MSLARNNNFDILPPPVPENDGLFGSWVESWYVSIGRVDPIVFALLSKEQSVQTSRNSPYSYILILILILALPLESTNIEEPVDL